MIKKGYKISGQGIFGWWSNKEKVCEIQAKALQVTDKRADMMQFYRMLVKIQKKRPSFNVKRVMRLSYPSREDYILLEEIIKEPACNV